MSREDELCQQVTVAIGEWEEAARKVMRIEEELATLTSPSSVEGAVARRGAVRAAVAGNLEVHARELVARYLAEEGIDTQLRAALEALLP